MGDAGGGSELSELPTALAEQSLSKSAIILPLDAAIEAVEHLARAGRTLENWEGWIRLRGGNRMKSISVSGSFALPPDPKRAAEVATKSMRDAAQRWSRNPDDPGAALYFGLTFSK